MSNLRFALFGTGFWSRYQLAGWREIPGAECVAIYGRNLAKAKDLADTFDIPTVYDDAEALIRDVRPDFIDIVTNVETHRQFVELAAKNKVPIICQKPMGVTLADAESMVAACENAGVPYFVNENWRWQEPIRALKAAFDEGGIGDVFRARISMITGFPVFINQPFFKDLEQFLIKDLGSHLLDVARFFFGEAASVYCHTQRAHPDIKGEDVATIMLRMESGATVLCEMAYAENYLERDHFPETFLFIEGTQGSLELAPNFWVRKTTEEGTHAKRYPPHRYPWADPAYDIAHGSIVPCQANILAGLRGEDRAETTGQDNLKTVRLVFASYESQATGEVVRICK